MWSDIWPVMLRHIINDVDTPQTYTDSRLEQALLVGAYFVNTEMTMKTHYSIDITGLSINPDPTVSSTLDEWMTNLTLVRTGWLMLQNDLKLASLSAWKIRDVDMQVDMSQLVKGKELLLKQIMSAWDLLRSQYMVGANPQVAAVLTPINIFRSGMRSQLISYSERDQVIF